MSAKVAPSREVGHTVPGVLCLTLLLLGLVVAPARAENSREALEEALRTARADLPRRAPAWGAAVAGIIQQDPKRGTELVREGIRLVAKGHWEGQAAEYQLVQYPFQSLAGVDFGAALEVAVEKPERLFGYLQEPFRQLMSRSPEAGERWAAEMVHRAPKYGVPVVRYVFTYEVGYLRYVGQQPEIRQRWTAARADFTRLLKLLPPGRDRSELRLQAGLAILPTDPEQGRAWLREALMESPGLRLELEAGVYSTAARDYPQVSGRAIKPDDWKPVVERYRGLDTEAGLAGIIRPLATVDDATGMSVARSIQDTDLRALAFSEFLEYATRTYPGQRFPESHRDAAVALRELLPAVHRPTLRAYTAYRLASWERLHQPELAGPHYRMAFDATEGLQGEDRGLFTQEHGYLPLPTFRGVILGYLSHYRPAEALKLALRYRRPLGEMFRPVVLHAAAHAPSSAQAESWLRTYLPRGDGGSGHRDFAIVAMEPHAERSVAVVKGMRPGYERDLLLILLVASEAPRRPEEALGLDPLFKSDAARSAAYMDAVEQVRDSGPDRMLLFARKVPLALSRADAIKQVVDVLLYTERERPDASRVERARRVAAEMPDEGPKWQAMEQVTVALPDAETAFHYARGIGRYTERVHAEEEALLRLVPKHAAHALELAREETSDEGRVDLAASIGARLAESDPEDAVRLAHSLDHRPTREQVLASAIAALLGSPEGLDRALELAKEVVTGRAAGGVYPRLWLAAVQAKKRPEQVWPLYRWISRNGYWWGWNEEMVEAAGATDAEADRGRYDPEKRRQAVIRLTASWLRGFPREEWTTALKPYVEGEPEGRIEPGFLAHVAAVLARTDAPAAAALVESGVPGDQGWLEIAPVLAERDLARGEQAAARVQKPRNRVTVMLALARAAAGNREAADRLRRAALRAGSEWSEEIDQLKSPSDRADLYLQLAQEFYGAGQDGIRYVRSARAEAVLVHDPLRRAGLLGQIEALERARRAPLAPLTPQ